MGTKKVNEQFKQCGKCDERGKADASGRETRESIHSILGVQGRLLRGEGNIATS